MHKSFKSFVLAVVIIMTISVIPVSGRDDLGIQKDSLMALIDNSKSSNNKADWYNELSQIYIVDTLQRIKYANIAYNLAKKDNYLAGKLGSLVSLAEMHFRAANYYKCTEVINRGLNLLVQGLDQKNDKVKLHTSKLYRLEGRTQMGQKKYFASLEPFNKSLEIAKGVDNTYCGETLIYISYVYTLVGDYDLSNEILQQATTYFAKANNTKSLIVCYNNLGNNYLQKKNYKKALEEIEHGIEKSEEIKYNRLLGLLKLNRALCLYELGRNEEAYNNFETSLSLFELNVSENYSAYSRLYMARIKFAVTKSEKLLSEYRYALDIGVKYDDIELQLKSADALSDGLAKLGQHGEAYKNAILSTQLKDSLTDSELLLKLRSLDDRNNYEMDKRRIEVEKAQEVADTKIDYQSKIICLLIGLVLISLISGFLLFKAYRASAKAKKDLIINNTELQRVEARLSESNKEMQDYIDLNVELEQFAYIASHDIKSPLRTIKSFAGLLKYKFYKTAEDKHKSYFDFIENGINSLNLLVDDLLEYSKSVKKNLKIESFELNEVIQDVIQLLDFSINQVNGKIEVKNADVSIHADKIKIKQVIQNLLSNALKFVDKDRPPHIIIEAKDDSNYLIVSVKDNGIGIEEQHFDQVFNKFTRLNSKSTYEGTGLGLSICAKYIKEHNGTISISKNQDHGVTFTFSIATNLETSNT